ncbi:MAG: AAC(3) family N-acetyltransferase [Chloroflexi bacterium]|nr:AAC(3) family N-acetyltransferase [Chloroflexota bacterium]
MTDNTLTTPIGKDVIMRGLRALGVCAGMGLMVHSSLRSFGHVEGGASSVIEALMEVVTPAGTLLLPTFNHNVPFEQDGPGFYDPLSTPTINGAIPDRFWRMPGVHRSLDPTHPFAAWGKHAQRFVAGHHRTLTMGPQSPLGLLQAEGGYGLLLGVGYGSNTFHHVVETALGVPCLGRRTEAYPILLPGGRRVEGRTWGWRNGVCPFTDQNRYGEVMRARGLDRVGLIGHCRATLFALQDCFDVVSEMLQQGRDGFPPCSGCSIRPRVVAQTAPSDWDEVGQTLLPGSVGWTY